MLSRAHVKTLVLSFFSEQGHTYENIWAWIWDFVASCSRPEKYKMEERFKNIREGIWINCWKYNRSDLL